MTVDTKRFDVEQRFFDRGPSGRTEICWRVIAEGVEATHGEGALKVALGAEEWKAEHAYVALHVVSEPVAAGSYRAMEVTGDGRRNWVEEFVIGTRHVLDIARAEQPSVPAAV